MAKKAPEPQARVLCDVPALGLKAGQIVQADPATLKALEGSVDVHHDAVAYAKSQGAEIVTL